MTKLCQILGRKVRKYRKLKNYSAAEFAKELGVSAGLINNIENARNDVFKLELLLKIMDKLEVSLGELLQLKTIDIRNINISQKNNLSIDKLINDNEEIVDLINYKINLIIRSYLTTISRYGCTIEYINIISDHILQEFEYLIKLQRINSSAPSK